MKFEWDTTKSETCFTQRGFDFAYVLKAFIDPHRLVQQDTRLDYRETRYQLLGAIEQRVFFVVYTIRAEVVRIISARKANQREVQYYEKNIRKIGSD